jgi:hypothetical protein
MTNTLYLTLFYFMFTAIAVFVTKPANATLVLSDLNGDTVLYDAGRGLYILPVYNYGDFVFTGDYIQRLSDAQTFASSISYGGVNGWKVHRGYGTSGSPGVFDNSNRDNIDLAFGFGIFGDVQSYNYGIGVGDQNGWFNDCYTDRYDFLNNSCRFRVNGSGFPDHAIYEIDVVDFSVVGGHGQTPEVSAPHSLSLIGLGLLGLVLRRFKKQTI